MGKKEKDVCLSPVFKSIVPIWFAGWLNGLVIRGNIEERDFSDRRVTYPAFLFQEWR